MLRRLLLAAFLPFLSFSAFPFRLIDYDCVHSAYFNALHDFVAPTATSAASNPFPSIPQFDERPADESCPYGALVEALYTGLTAEAADQGSPASQAAYARALTLFTYIYENYEYRMIPLLNSRWGRLFTWLLGGAHLEYAISTNFRSAWPCPHFALLPAAPGGGPPARAEEQLDWRGFQETALPRNSRPFSEWMMDVSKISFRPNILVDLAVSGAADECRGGALLVLTHKLYVAVHRAFDQIISVSDAILEVVVKTGENFGLRRVLLGRWPWTNLLKIVEQTKRTNGVGNAFSHDLTPHEIAGQRSGAGNRTTYGSSELGSPTFISLQTAITQFTKKQPVYITFVWGARLARYIPKFAERMKSLGIQTVVFALDEVAAETCEENADERLFRCVRGKAKSFFGKFTLLTILLQEGFDAVVLDFDLVLLQDPSGLFLGNPADIQVSRSFGDECMNIGLFYVRANEHTVEFFLHLINWLWVHPFDHDQVAFQTLLEKDFKWLRASDPRWPHFHHLKGIREKISVRILDPYNAFSTARVYHYDGWTGEIEKIVAFHFLDGQGAVNEGDAVNGVYVNHWNLFYGNEKISFFDSRPIYEQDPAVFEGIMASRVAAVPDFLNPCITWDSRDP